MRRGGGLPLARAARCAVVCAVVGVSLAILPAACGDGASSQAAGDATSGEDGAGGGADAESGCFTLADGRCVVETFRNPPVLAPGEDGVYRLTLAATEVVLDGQRHCVRAYNGAYPGPTIETAARGDAGPRRIRVDLANRLVGHDLRTLSGQVCTCTDAAGAACTPAGLHDPCAHGGGAHGCTCRDESGEPCEHLFDFNVTNLHAHGAHVRPDWARGGEACAQATEDGVTFACRECGDDVCDGAADDACFHGDNVLNALRPGEGARYRWDIDEDGTHHTGLQWYHPHIHGTTAIQVASGAAGAWIVRGALDELPGIAAARERVMIFSTPPIRGPNGFAPLAFGEACSDETLTFDDFVTLGAVTAPQLNLLNGLRRPRLVTPPGQVERWRILHAGYLDEVFLGLFRGQDGDCESWSAAEGDRLQLVQIGRDGLILPEPFAADYVFLSPGYRVEGLLGGSGRLADGDTWCLVAARALQAANEAEFGPFGAQPMSPAVPPTPADVLALFESAGDVVAILDVTAAAGPATTTTLPDLAAIGALAPPMDLGGVDIETRCAQAAAETDVTAIDQAAVLQVGFWTIDDPDPCDCAAYNVNCHNFEETDRSRYPFDRDLPLGAVEHWRVGASLDGHPFHIHINPFVVCPAPNVFDPLPFPHWRDTYLVNAGRTVDIITENRSYTGPYVFHCHKLTHEDHGMMELIRVCDPASDDSCGDYHWRACDEGDADCAMALAATDCALASRSTPETTACLAALAAPGGVCGDPACVTDADCGEPDRCADGACVPAPCAPPCAPGTRCVHGACE